MPITCQIPASRAARNGVLLIIATLVVASTALATPLRLGIMGDSLSAGTGSANGEFPNWNLQLSNAGVVSIVDNAAVNGASTTSTTNNLTTQIPGIVSLVNSNALDDSVLMIGGNDFNPSISAFAGTIFLGTATGPARTSYISTVVTNIENTLGAVSSAGSVPQVLANIPDITVTPFIVSNAAFLGGAAGLGRVSSDIASVNSIIDAYALSHGIPVLDLYKLSQTVLTLNSLTLAGVTYSHTALFAPDGFHPAPVMHGLLANTVVDAMDLRYHQGASPLSDQQVVQNSGRTPTVTGPTFFDVTPYVLVPEPSSLLLAVFGFIGLIACVRRRER